LHNASAPNQLCNITRRLPKAKADMKVMKDMKAMKESPTSERSEAPADLARPAAPGAVSVRPATDKTRKDLGFRFRFVVLSGRGSRTHRLAAAGGRQVSAAFMSFMLLHVLHVCLALGKRTRPDEIRS
jgi:hypothetical protein